MSDVKSQQPALSVRRSAKDTKILTQLRGANLVDLAKVGRAVSELGPTLLDPGDSASDYIVTIGESFCKLYKFMPGHDIPSLEDKSAIQGIVNRPQG